MDTLLHQPDQSLGIRLHVLHGLFHDGDTGLLSERILPVDNRYCRYVHGNLLLSQLVAYELFTQENPGRTQPNQKASPPAEAGRW